MSTLILSRAEHSRYRTRVHPRTRASSQNLLPVANLPSLRVRSICSRVLPLLALPFLDHRRTYPISSPQEEIEFHFLQFVLKRPQSDLRHPQRYHHHNRRLAHRILHDRYLLLLSLRVDDSSRHEIDNAQVYSLSVHQESSRSIFGLGNGPLECRFRD